MNNNNDDYYKILGVKNNSSDDEIKKAYKKEALKWHPDRNINQKEYATEKFKKINEAYDVLGNPEKKKNYDILRMGPNFTNTQSFNPQSFNTQKEFDFFSSPFKKQYFDNSNNKYNLHFKNPFEIFQMFSGKNGIFKNAKFETDSNISISTNSTSTYTSSSDDVNIFFNNNKNKKNKKNKKSKKIRHSNSDSDSDSNSGSDSDSSLYSNSCLKKQNNEKNISEKNTPEKTNKGETIHEISVDLEILYNGASKKFLISTEKDKKIFEISIKPGWKDGTKITFDNDEIFGKIVFVIKEKSHNKFKRRGNDLIYRQRYLKKNKELEIVTLSGKKINLDLSNQKRGNRIIVSGEGMPVRKNETFNGYGDLIVELY